MKFTRRNTLAILGGGLVLAAAGGSYRVTRFPNKALAPWSNAGLYDEPRMRALSYAILSPNPHNRQPWMVDISTPDELTLYVDTARMLEHTDPFNRQITIGLGCFLETLSLAARDAGQTVELELFPDGEKPDALDGRPVAIARFTNGGSPDPLFVHVLDRRTQKEPYDLSRPVPDAVLPILERACIYGSQTGSTNDAPMVEVLRKLSHDALVIEGETARTYKESVDLFRIGSREVDANPDGIDFTGPLFEGLAAAGLFTREAALDTNSSTFRQGAAMILKNADTAMGHVWLTSEANTRVDQINAGRDWMRLHLAATAQGIALQPLSQALQEYPEMVGKFADIHKILAPEGGTVQMFARLGYCESVRPSPRWPIEEKLLNG